MNEACCCGSVTHQGNSSTGTTLSATDLKIYIKCIIYNSIFIVIKFDCVQLHLEQLSCVLFNKINGIRRAMQTDGE